MTWIKKEEENHKEWREVNENEAIHYVATEGWAFVSNEDLAEMIRNKRDAIASVSFKTNHSTGKLEFSESDHDFWIS